MLVPASTYVEPALQAALERFLFEEAELLDQRRFRDWLGHYWVPAQLTSPPPLRTGIPASPVLSLTLRRLSPSVLRKP